MRWSVWSYLEIYCGYPTNHRMPYLVILHSIHIWLHGLSVCIVPPTIPRSVGPKTAVTYTFTQTPTLMTDDTSGTPETHTSHDSSILTIYVHLELLPFPTYVTGTICVPCHFICIHPLCDSKSTSDPISYGIVYWQYISLHKCSFYPVKLFELDF